MRKKKGPHIPDNRKGKCQVRMVGGRGSLLERSVSQSRVLGVSSEEGRSESVRESQGQIELGQQ